MYRKITEKSRAFFQNFKNCTGKSIDGFLFLAVVVLTAALFVVGFFLKTINSLRRTDLFVSPQCETIFGRDTMDALIREFEDQNPELRIRRAAGVPDLVFFDEGDGNALARDGALASLSPYLAPETEQSPGAPLVFFMDLFVYNIELLKSIEYDRPPKTRIEFLAAARAIAALNGAAADDGSAVYGYALGLSENDPLALRREIYSWIWAAGGEILLPGEPGGPPELSRTAADIIGFFGQLNREGLLPPGTFTKTGAERLEEFARGKIAMMTISARELPLLKKRMGGAAFGLTVIPAATAQGKTLIGLSGIYAGISAASARPDDAWTFLAFLAGQSKTLSASLEAVPGSLPGIFPETGAFPGSYIQDDSLYAKAWDIFEAAETVTGYTENSQSEIIEPVVWEQLRRYLDR